MITIISKNQLVKEYNHRIGHCVSVGGEGCILYEGDFRRECDITDIAYGGDVMTQLNGMWIYKSQSLGSFRVASIEFGDSFVKVESTEGKVIVLSD